MSNASDRPRSADRRDPRLQAMAANALNLVTEEKYDEARSVLEDMAASYGGDGAIQAALLWIDTLAAKLGAANDGQGVALMFKAVETGEIGGADGRRPTVVWAGRLVTARLADDEATFVALINTAGKRDIGPYIGELLHMVALSIKQGELLGRK